MLENFPMIYSFLDRRSYKAEMIKTEWQELMESSNAALDNSDMFHTLPKSYSKSGSVNESGKVGPFKSEYGPDTLSKGLVTSIKTRP